MLKVLDSTLFFTISCCPEYSRTTYGQQISEKGVQLFQHFLRNSFLTSPHAESPKPSYIRDGYDGLYDTRKVLNIFHKPIFQNPHLYHLARSVTMSNRIVLQHLLRQSFLCKSHTREMCRITPSAKTSGSSRASM